MVKEYSCEKCGKIFTQKGHYLKHLKRKTPCKPIDNKVIDQKVQEKIKELSENGEIKMKFSIENNLIDIQNTDGIQYLTKVNDNSVDLVLTDPPYITSTETGMGNLYKQIQENKKKGIEFVKT